MPRKIKLDKLIIEDSLNAVQKSLPPIDCLKLMIAEKDANFCYIITNKFVTKKPSYYSLYLDHKRIDLIEKSKDKKKEQIFTFGSEAFEVNGKEKGRLFLDEFNQKIDQIINDLKLGQASLCQPKLLEKTK